jgi:competence protein ComEC
VVVLVAVDGGLATSIGFQLSVAATAGILAGIPLWRDRRPRLVWATLGATVAAQATVAPLLLLHFGAVPLLAPLANLMAVPLVVAATGLGGIGLLVGADRIVALAAACAGLVLRVARGAADLPQLGAVPVALTAALVALAALWRGLRPLLAAVMVVVVGIAVIPPGPPGGPVVSFLDIGQGDATLLRGPGGETILVDGGPDPALLRSHLRNAGVRRIDLLVVTHTHADHTAGLAGLHVPVARMWYAPHLAEGPPYETVVLEQTARGTIMEAPAVGTVAVIGAFTIEVLGPLRRYASLNDESLVIRVTAAGVKVLLTGDVERIAQRDLGVLSADVLKVPHQGGATSDLDWLTASGAAIAVISVGSNDFGHPSAELITALGAAGMVVYRTDRDGTIDIRLDRLRLPVTPLPSPG